MATLNPVHKRDCRECNRCGSLITFVRNRNDKLYPVDVYNDPRFGLVFRSGIGAYGNLTPWHKCDEVLRRKEEAKRRTIEERKNSVAKEYLPRLQEMAVRFGQGEATSEECEALGAEYKAALDAIGTN